MVCVVPSDSLVSDIKANRTRDVKNNKKKSSQLLLFESWAQIRCDDNWMLRKWPREVSAAFGGWRDRAGQEGAITADNEDWRGVRTWGVAVGLIKWQLINSQVCVCVCLVSLFCVLALSFLLIIFVPLAFLHPLLALILSMASLIFFSLCQRSLLLNLFSFFF